MLSARFAKISSVYVLRPEAPTPVGSFFNFIPGKN